MPEENGNDAQLTKHNLREIAHNSGVDRVSGDALIRIALEEECRLQQIFHRSELLAQKDGRKTVQERDIRTVYAFLEDDL